MTNRRRERVRRLVAKRPKQIEQVIVERREVDDPHVWSQLVRLLAELLDTPNAPEESRKV